MSRNLMVLCVVFAFLAAAPAIVMAKKPPSFALWTVAENNHEDSLINPVTDQCGKVFAHNDLKAGECLAAGLLKVYSGANAYWERGLARVAKDQKRVCKKAIHSYFLAAQKNFKAVTAYLSAHRHRPLPTSSVTSRESRTRRSVAQG